MNHIPPGCTDAEIIVDLEFKAAHWEKVAGESPADVAYHCIDYAKHLRTLAECKRMDTIIDAEQK